MRVSVRGNFRDLLAFLRLISERRRRIRRAAATPVSADPLRELSQSLHPDRLDLVVEQVREEGASARTYRLLPAAGAASRRPLPFFRAGQYLSLFFNINGSTVSRPYSLSSSPAEAAEHNYYELTIRLKPAGLVSPHIWEHWRPGTAVRSSGPLGQFGYEPLRDSDQVVFLAGGCGITPFRALLRDFSENLPEVRCTLLYGVRRAGDILFGDELEALQAARPENLRVHYLCSEPEAGWRGAVGLLSAERIRELAGPVEGKSFFVSGPREMHEFLDRELASLGLPPGRVRREARGEPADASRRPDFPPGLAGRIFSLQVRLGQSCRRIPALAEETVLVALERAALAPPAACRSGECGCCRSRLISGRVYVIAESDGRRLADRRYGYFHPCSSYPLSDLEIEVPYNPLLAEETSPEFSAARGGNP